MSELQSRIENLSPLKRALLAMEQLEAELDGYREPIAIVGVGCRYPGGVRNVEDLWRVVLERTDTITEVPPERWDVDAHYHPDPRAPGKIATRWGGFLEDIDRFDPAFFDIAPREVPHMDPQQRLLLEVAWEAIEDAGVTDLRGSRTGVFTGIINNEYGWLQLGHPTAVDAYTGTGTSFSVASGRLSYTFDLRGPSISVDTACSSSLVATHLACTALRNRECDRALAGGVSVMLSPACLMPFTKMGVLAPDGRCKTFDARADGFVGGEGVAMLVLERLSDAIARGDRILAVIKGSAINQDGKSAVISAPNGPAQSEVLRRALDVAGVEASSVAFVEAHGTGTALGDPIEVEALSAVYQHQIALGSIKTNFGHTGGAAGVAGLLKAAMAVNRGVVPPSAHFETKNPSIEADCVVPTEPCPFAATSGDGPARAGVSAFGWAGTNAHVIVEAPPRQTDQELGPQVAEVLCVSARTAEGLRDLAQAYGRLDCTPARCRSSSTRRRHHEHRLAIVADGDPRSAIEAFLADTAHPGVAHGARIGAARRLAFIFPPHGSQWSGLGKELLAHEPVFAETIDEWDAAIREEAGWSVRGALAGRDDEWMDRIDRLQPTLVAFEHALACWWRSRGVEPDAVVGHSMGEVAAAAFAEVLTIREASMVICARTRLLGTITGEGAMGLVELDLAEAERRIAPYGDRLTIATSNAPRSTVVAGDPDTLEALLDALSEEDIFCGWGVADVASHGPQLASLAKTLAASLAGLDPKPGTLPLVSSVTGATIRGQDLGPEYWARHLTSTVRFADATRALVRDGRTVFLELSPHPILTSAVEETLVDLGEDGAAVGSLRRDAPERRALLEAAGSVYAAGVDFDWTAMVGPVRPEPLPRYPFARERFWLERSSTGSDAASLTGRRIDLASSSVFEAGLDPVTLPALYDHRVGGAAVLPASAYALLAAGVRKPPFALESLELRNALRLGEGQVGLQMTLDGERLSIHARAAAAPTDRAPTAAPPAEHSRDHAAGAGTTWTQLAVASLGPAPRSEAFDVAAETTFDLYAALAERGVEIGDGLRAVESAAWGRGVATARGKTTIPDHHPADPALFDAPFQLLSALVARTYDGVAPTGMRALVVHRIPEGDVELRARMHAGTSVGDAVVLDDAGVAIEVRGLCFTPIARPTRATEIRYHLDWEDRPLAVDESPLPRGRWWLHGDDIGLADALRSRNQTVASTAATDDVKAALRHATDPMQPELHGVVLFARPPAARVVAEVSAAARALSTREGAPRVWLVTHRATASREGELTGADEACAWGVGRVLAEEHRELWGGLIDVDDRTPSSVVADALIRGDDDRQVAFDGERRRVPRLRRAATSGAPLPLRADGSYLITGGLGGVGLAVARGLVEAGARHLIVASRSPVPERAQWRDSSDPRIDALLALEHAGADVRATSLDVTQHEALHGFLTRERAERRPPIRGVLHAAGVIDDGLLADLHPERIAPVLAPKIDGARNLAEACGDLDFLVFFSSLGALMGGAGQGAYAAANAFLDAYALQLRHRGVPASVVNWGFWRELGFSDTPGGRRAIRHMERRGLYTLSPPVAAALLSQQLGGSDAQTVVADVDWALLAATASVPAPLIEHVLPVDADTAVVEARAAEILAADDPLAAMEAHLIDVVARVLRSRPETLDPKTPLGALGFDSFAAIELRNRLERTLDLTLSATMAWNYPTIGQLAAHLHERLSVTANDAPAEAPDPGDEEDDELAALLAAAALDDEASDG